MLACPACSSTASLNWVAIKTRNLVVEAGPLTFGRAVLECARCRKQFAPADQILRLPERQHLSPRLCRKLARLGTRMDYQAAVEEMHYLLEVSVSAKEAQLTTRQAGQAALALREEQTARWSAPVEVGKAPPAPEKRHEAVVLEIDGTCVLGRQGAGREIKVATVFGLDERGETSSGRAMLSERRWCATARGVEEFSRQTQALANRWGAREAARIAVIADGAAWIWNLAKERFGRAVCILDLWHASEHLHELARDVWPGQEREGAGWAHEWTERLKQLGGGALLVELELLRRKHKGAKRERIEQEQGYFRNNQSRMNYPAYIEQGWPIGSGAVEGACKTLIKERMAGAGQRWSEDGMEEMAALRSALFNDDWEAVFEQAA